MEINEFIEKFAEAIEVEEIDNLTPDTNFRELDEWSSLAALSVIAFADEEFEKDLNANSLRNANTITDLYELIAK